MSEINRIEIKWVSGTVNVVAYDGDDIVFDEESSRTLDEDNKMRYRIEDGKLSIQFFKSRIFSFFNTVNLLSLIHI